MRHAQVIHMNVVTRLLLISALVLTPVVVPDPFWLRLAVLTLLTSIALLGLNVASGFAGQVSLCQAAFYGAGAYTSAIASIRLGFPITVSVAAAALVTSLLALLLGAATIRLQAHYLTLATIGFGEVLVNVFRSATELTGGANGLSGIPTFPMSDVLRYWTVLAVTVGTFSAVSRVLSSPIGLVFRTVREDELAAESIGINTRRMRLAVFGVSGLLGGLAGALYGHYDGFIGPESFSTAHSILMFCAVVTVGLGSVAGSVPAAALLVLVQEYFRSFMHYQVVLFGLTVMILASLSPKGFRTLVDFGRRRRATVVPAVESDSQLGWERSDGATHLDTSAGEDAVRVRGVMLRFGGVQALRGVDVNIPSGKIFFIIGPNGAGKTTLLNILNGFLQPDSGTVEVRDRQSRSYRQVNGRSVHEVARLGIARVFQLNRLFRDLTVLENVLVGVHTVEDLRPRVIELFLAPRRARAKNETARREAARLLGSLGLAEQADLPARLLPFGQQRLLELARCAALRPEVILLDEPSAGLSALERGALIRFLLHLRNKGVTLVVVAHDLDFVRELAELVAVLDQGEKIFEGTPENLWRCPGVLDAYIGTGGPPDVAG
jgi:branched-chain amino acid transport system permease protein